MNKLTSVKNIATLIFTVLFTWLIKDGTIDQEAYKSLMTIMVIGFITGNVGAKIANNKAGKDNVR